MPIFGIVLMILIMIGTRFYHHNIYYIAFILPAFMFIAGCILYSVRNKFGSIFGFHTGASERNMDTWRLGNIYCGLKLIKWSAPLLIFSELIMFIIQPKATIAESIILFQMIPLFAIIISTEKEINKQYDYLGNRRENVK